MVPLQLPVTAIWIVTEIVTSYSKKLLQKVTSYVAEL